MRETLLKLGDFPKAGQFINAVLAQQYRVIIYGGSIRGGKSFNSIGAAILLHKRFPKSRSAIIRKDLAVLRTNTLPTCDKVIPTNFVKSFKGDPQFQWTFKNDSTMFFFAEGYEKDKEYQRWNGLEVNFIILDQADELQLAGFEKSLERVGSYVIQGGNQPQPLIMATVNPATTWVKEYFYDRWKNGTLPRKWLYIPALLTDNPNIPESFKDSLQELKRINPIKYQRYVEGDWEVQDVVEGAFWKSFEYEKHVGEVKLTQDPIHVTFDENVNPYPATGIWQIDTIEMPEEDHYHVRQIHEISLKHPNNKLNKVAAELDRWCKMNSWKDIIYLYGDPTSAKEDTKLQAGYNYFTLMKKELESKGYTVRIRKLPSSPSVALSAAFINSIFEIEYGNIKITIDENCKDSINDFTQAREGPDGKMLKPKTQGIELHGHYSDSARYLLVEAFKNQYRQYQRGGSIITGGYEVAGRRKSRF